MFKKYLAYIKDNPERYWFKAKLYGWGWTPATWQGWLSIVIYLGLVFILSFTLDENASPKKVLLTFIIPVLLLTSALIYLAYKKGEKPRWRWGDKE